MSDLIAAAKSRATIAHEGQFRKKGNRPYIVHPERVAELAGPYTDELGVAAAWLHDVLEDTKLTIEDFPDAVRLTVDLLSRNKAKESKAEAIRKVYESKDRRAWVVKVADRIANLEDGAASMGADWFFGGYDKSSALILKLASDKLDKDHALVRHLSDALAAAHEAFSK